MSLNEFDPQLLGVITQFVALAIKYGAYFGVLKVVGNMIINAFSGKARFL